MITIEELNVVGYEQVVHATSENGLDGYFAIHSTLLGPAVGGCRMWSYDSDEKALEDALKLSKAMTYKSSLAGLDLGGGKCVINLKNTTKTRELLLEIGEVVETLGGKYIIAEDVGSSIADIKIVSENTSHVASLKDAGDPSQATAYGVMRGMEAALRTKTDKNNVFKGVLVFVEGMGNVGFNLAKFLINRGARVCGTDISDQAKQRSMDYFGGKNDRYSQFRWVENYDVLDFDLDSRTKVYAPCALGGIVSEKNLEKISNFDIICGSANNQLSDPLMGYALSHKNIIYVPDYLVNAGGVINCAKEIGGNYSPFDVAAHIDRIGITTLNIIDEAKNSGKPTNYIADELAERRLTTLLPVAKKVSEELVNSTWVRGHWSGGDGA